MMTEDEIRQFVDDACGITGDPVSANVIERITARWLQDQEAAGEEARDAVYDDFQDGWHTIS
jgi:hypothetical protein